MNIKKAIIAVTIIYLSSTSVLWANVPSKAVSSQLILGLWHCKIDVALVGMNMSIKMQNIFSEDQTAIGNGTVNVTNPAIGMDLTYEVKVAQTWFIQDNTLYQTITASNINSLTPSFFEALYDTDTLLPAGQQEATQIVSLTVSNFLGLYNGLHLMCTR